MIKTKYFAILMVAVMLLTSLPLYTAINVQADAIENLGTITECKVDRNAQTLSISGSIKHSVLVVNRESKIAVYRFDPWVNISSALKNAEPLETMDMTIRFEFVLPCTTVSHRLSLYAVAIISPKGEINLITDPQYVDYKTADTTSAGFKAVLTEDVAGAVAAHPGSAIVDVYLDKLDRGNKSGYIYNADGELFYFDREVIKELDKKILSYTASGATVYLRFLISADSDSLSFSTKGNLWAMNKCVVVSNEQALKSIYAYTSFLISRYDGAEHGKVDGIILGRGCDKPILYNYAALVSEDYETVYARSLALIGLAAAEAVDGGELSLIVPVGDSLTENGKVYAAEFLESVASYLETYTDFGFTVMCESMHNPYKLKDSDFVVEIDPDDPGEEEVFETEETSEETLITDASETTEESVEITDSETTTESVESETTAEETQIEEPESKVSNTDEDGYFCTDNIDTFLTFFNSIKKKYSSVNKGFAWCWYPDSQTAEGALGVCYAFNYMKLAAVGADFYAVAFESEVSDKFSSVSHLFKYIDTPSNIKETAYARSVFEIEDWSELIGGYSSDTGVFHNLYEISLDPNVMDYVGSVVYFDYSAGRGLGGWFDGLYCDSLGIHIEESESFLQATMDLDSAGVNQAEIGYIFETPEPLMMGDALTFDIQCGENDGSLYEVAVHIRSKDSTVVSKTVISGGVRSNLSVDVSNRDDTDGVDSIKITLTRVTGSGRCKLRLYKVMINSSSVTDEQLEKEFLDIREYLRSDSAETEEEKGMMVAAGLVILSVVGIVAVMAAYINDKKLRSNENNENEE